MNRKEEIHKEAMSMSFDYPYLCNEEDNNSEYVRKLEDIANWADKTMLDKVCKYLVERFFFTEDEAKEVCKGLKEESVVQPDYDKIAMYDCHTCANYQTKCNPENGAFECKNPPFTSMYDSEKLPFPRVNEFEVGASYRH